MMSAGGSLLSAGAYGSLAMNAGVGKTVIGSGATAMSPAYLPTDYYGNP